MNAADAIVIAAGLGCCVTLIVTGHGDWIVGVVLFTWLVFL